VQRAHTAAGRSAHVVASLSRLLFVGEGYAPPHDQSTLRADISA
jgi:hypothetical protein